MNQAVPASVGQTLLASTILRIVRVAAGPITGAAIAERLLLEDPPVNATSKQLLDTLDQLVELRYLERELLTGQRSTYRLHVEARAKAPAALPARASADPVETRKPAAAEKPIARVAVLELLKGDGPKRRAQVAQSLPGYTASAIDNALHLLLKQHQIARDAAMVYSFASDEPAPCAAPVQVKAQPARAPSAPVAEPQESEEIAVRAEVDASLESLRRRLDRPRICRRELKVDVLRRLAPMLEESIGTMLIDIAGDLEAAP